MSWLNEKIAEKWRKEGKRYAQSVNDFVRRSIAGEVPDESKLANDGRAEFSAEVWDMVKKGNVQNDLHRLRKELPAATWPFNETFQSSMQAVRVAGYLDNDTVVFNSGFLTDKGCVYTGDHEHVRSFPQYQFAGQSPDGEQYALAGTEGIRVITQPDRHLEGKEVAMFRWDDIQSAIHQALPRIESLADCEYPERTLEGLIPFDRGQALIILSHYGIYLVEHGKVSPMHPDPAEVEEHELEDTQISMGHAAVSQDGRWIAFGSQVSDHMLLDRERHHTYALYPESSYPHHAVFTRDHQYVWFNACHFYNGVTMQVNLDEVEGNESKEDWPMMDESARVYAAVEIPQGMVLGDAYGYLKCVDKKGQEVWRHFVGSTIYSLAISPDQSKLAVGTYGGMVHILNLHSDRMDDYSIGTGTLRELERFVVWRGEEPLRW
ncbi:hypothetical protein [Paenibacillus xylanilyticus]|uniref:WD40 repeat domain-containing protein n=1 Tax=Paenibacillus xylanilyticus TaxID=248903 RepID=A0A7Y6EYB4_9BACL|nr:hypothetical protein [Paenibacillus xylanilyticus]NUU78340.1 hypothetical protein [Paenibacillus xylanilyticus]